MHIKDHNDAMKFFRTYDNVASKGKWKEFVDEMEFDSMLQEPRTMAQEPRNMYADGQLVQNTVDGSRPGYGGPGSGAKKGSIPIQSSAQKKATYYKKLLNDLPEGYLEDYKKIFLNDRGDGIFSRKPGDAPEGILDMEKKYGDLLKGKTKNITRRVGEMNSAILQSLQEEGKIVSGLSDAKDIRKADLKIVGDIDLVAPKGKVTHHFMPLAGIEGEKINLSSTKNTAFIDKKLNAKMSQYDKKLKANQKEQIKLLDEKLPGWEKKIERLNYKAKNIYKEAGKKVPKSKGFLGYSQIVVKPDGTYDIKVTGIDSNKSFAGLKGEEIIYKNLSKESKKQLLHDLSTPEGRLANRQQGTAKILNKILENNKITICNDKLSNGKGVVCGVTFAERDPKAFLEAIKRNKDAAFIINKPGLVKGALRGLSGWAKGELGPFGWIGSLATIDAAFGVYELGQGATPLQALDETLWFLPKSWLKADEKTFKDVYQRAGFTDEDFGEFQKWMKLEDLDQQYFTSKKQLEFMEGQVLEPEKKSAADISYQKEVDALPDAYKDKGWNRPLFAITSEEEKTGEHPFYGPAVDRYNKILTESKNVYESLKDPEKSQKDLDYSRKFAAMERANRKKQMHLATLEGQTGYGESMEEILDRSGNLDLLYPEYVHPIEGPSVSQEQMMAAGFAEGGIASLMKKK